MKHFKSFVIALTAAAALLMSTSAFASADYFLQIKNAKGQKVASVRCANGTWTVDTVPPDTYTVVVVDGAGNDVTNLIRASVKIQGFVVNSHSGAFDLAVFGFEPQPVQASSKRTFAAPHVFESKGRCSAKVTITNFDDSAYLKTKHETAKNAVGNIR